MHRRVHEPEALDLRSAVWSGGRFDAGRRPFTARVEGVTRTGDHLLLATVRGGARCLTVRTDDGHAYDGPDSAGAVSLVPAGCERHIVLEDVAAEWASVSLSPAILLDETGRAPALAPFSNVEDPFVASVVGEFDRAHRRDGTLDPAYGETLSLALGAYVVRRAGTSRPPARGGLAPYRLSRVREFVDANLDRPVAIAEMAEVAGMSPGHFHRAFREAAGVTPLRYLNGRRIERATAMLLRGSGSVVDVAAAVGFESPSHFARVFRSITGRRPSEARRG